MVFDPNAVGVGISAIFGIAGVIWGWVQKQRTVVSETKARVAEDDRDREMANSAGTLYSLLNERLKTVEAELRELKAHSRKQEVHITKLEQLMREHGITPPMFEM